MLHYLFLFSWVRLVVKRVTFEVVTRVICAVVRQMIRVMVRRAICVEVVFVFARVLNLVNDFRWPLKAEKEATRKPFHQLATEKALLAFVTAVGLQIPGVAFEEQRVAAAAA